MRSWDGIQGGKYFLVETMDQFHLFLRELKQQKLIAVDTETSGFDWLRDRIAGIVVGWSVEHNFYLPVGHSTGEKQLDLAAIRPALRDVFEDPTVTKVFWNEKFDRHFLRQAGFEIKGVRHDGIILAHLLDENEEKGLKEVATRYFKGSNPAKWEDALHTWRVDEGKRRRKGFTDLTKQMLAEKRTEIEAEFFAERPFLKFAMKPQAVTAELKKVIKKKLSEHIFAKNKKDDVTYDYVPLEIITPYACADVHYTLLFYKQYVATVGAHDALKRLYINEAQLSDLLFEVESHGIKIDVPYLNKCQPKLESEIAASHAEIMKAVQAQTGNPDYTFDLESNDQLIQAFKEMGIRLTKLTKKGKEAAQNGQPDKVKFAVDKEVLEQLAATHLFAKQILDYRSKQKLLNTYVISIRELVDERHYLHSSFNANVATGRMSSREPNIQNIPGRDKTIRKAFTIPEEVGFENVDLDKNEWVFVFMDYSQVELRLTAHHSQDETLLAAYSPLAPGWIGKEQDVHSITCAEVVMRRPLTELEEILATENLETKHPEFDDVKWYRNIAKRVNFGIIYGAAGGAIQRQVSTPKRPVSRDECDQYIAAYFEKYTGVKGWIDLTHRLMKRDGWLVNSFGRYRRLPNVTSAHKWEIERACRQGVNFLIQGDAADLFKHAAVRVRNFLKRERARTRIVNFVHDEIQFYWHKSEFHLLKPVKKLMEDFPQFRVPILVEVDTSRREWANKKKLKA
jgi:DNA polymerase I-like protein with 3'-5' exonuclease and polymerase domains